MTFRPPQESAAAFKHWMRLAAEEIASGKRQGARRIWTVADPKKIKLFVRQLWLRKRA